MPHRKSGELVNPPIAGFWALQLSRASAHGFIDEGAEGPWYDESIAVGAAGQAVDHGAGEEAVA